MKTFFALAVVLLATCAQGAWLDRVSPVRSRPTTRALRSAVPGDESSALGTDGKVTVYFSVTGEEPVPFAEISLNQNFSFEFDSDAEFLPVSWTVGGVAMAMPDDGRVFTFCTTPEYVRNGCCDVHLVCRRTVFVDASADAANTNLLNYGYYPDTAAKTIASGAALAMDGATVRVASGEYAPVALTNRTLVVACTNYADKAVIDGQHVERCFASVDGDGAPFDGVTLEGFVLRNGQAEYGGGAYGGRLRSCRIVDCRATGRGGGASDAELRSCLVDGNEAGISDGAASHGSLYECTVSGNSAPEYGAFGFSRVCNCVVVGNVSTSSGPEFSTNATDLAVCLVDSNVDFSIVGVDYHLFAGSAGVGVGVPEYATELVDFEGMPRVDDGGRLNAGCLQTVVNVRPGGIGVIVNGLDANFSPLDSVRGQGVEWRSSEQVIVLKAGIGVDRYVLSGSNTVPLAVKIVKESPSASVGVDVVISNLAVVVAGRTNDTFIGALDVPAGVEASVYIAGDNLLDGANGSGKSSPGIKVASGGRVNVRTLDGYGPANAKLTSIGGDGAAGIGASMGNGGFGDVYVYGGDVLVQGGRDAAGIGGGSSGEDVVESRTATICIAGGIVTALTDNQNAAAIGTGFYRQAHLAYNIDISGGTVRVEGSNNRGVPRIGTSKYYQNSSDRVRITGGSVVLGEELVAATYPSPAGSSGGMAPVLVSLPGGSIQWPDDQPVSVTGLPGYDAAAAKDIYPTAGKLVLYVSPDAHDFIFRVDRRGKDVSQCFIVDRPIPYPGDATEYTVGDYFLARPFVSGLEIDGVDAGRGAGAGWTADFNGNDRRIVTLTGPGCVITTSSDTNYVALCVTNGCTEFTLRNATLRGMPGARRSPLEIALANNDKVTMFLEGTNEIHAAASVVDGVNTNSHPGIQVEGEAQLAIDKVPGAADSACRLKVVGGSRAPAIGACFEMPVPVARHACGWVTVLGGWIEAFGGVEGAPALGNPLDPSYGSAPPSSRFYQKGGYLHAVAGANAPSIGVREEDTRYYDNMDVEVSGGTLWLDATNATSSTEVIRHNNASTYSFRIYGGSVADWRTMCNETSEISPAPWRGHLVTVTLPGEWSLETAVTVVGLVGYSCNSLYPVDGRLFLYLTDGQYDFAVCDPERGIAAGYRATVAGTPTNAVSGVGVQVNGEDISSGGVGVGAGAWAYDSGTGVLELGGEGPYLLSGALFDHDLSIMVATNAEITASGLLLAAGEDGLFELAHSATMRFEHPCRFHAGDNPTVRGLREDSTITVTRGGTVDLGRIDAHLVVTGGSVRYSSARSATDGRGHAVHEVKLVLSRMLAEVDALEFGFVTCLNGYDVSNIRPEYDGNSPCAYLQLPDGVYSFTVNDFWYEFTVAGNNLTVNYQPIGLRVNGVDVGEGRGEGWKWTRSGSDKLLELDGSCPQYVLSGYCGSSSVVVPVGRTVHVFFDRLDAGSRSFQGDGLLVVDGGTMHYSGYGNVFDCDTVVAGGSLDARRRSSIFFHGPEGEGLRSVDFYVPRKFRDVALMVADLPGWFNTNGIYASSGNGLNVRFWLPQDVEEFEAGGIRYFVDHESGSFDSCAVEARPMPYGASVGSDDLSKFDGGGWSFDPYDSTLHITQSGWFSLIESNGVPARVVVEDGVSARLEFPTGRFSASIGGTGELVLDRGSAVIDNVSCPLTVTGGSYRVVSSVERPRNASGPVYAVKVPVGEACMSLADYSGPYPYMMEDARPIDGAWWLYLPEGTHCFRVAGRLWRVVVAAGMEPVVAEALEAGFTVNGADVSAGEGDGWRYDFKTGDLHLESGGTFELSGSNIIGRTSVVLSGNKTTTLRFPHPAYIDGGATNAVRGGAVVVESGTVTFASDVVTAVDCSSFEIRGGSVNVADGRFASLPTYYGDPLTRIEVAVPWGVDDEHPLAFDNLVGYDTSDIYSVSGKVTLWLPFMADDFSSFDMEDSLYLVVCQGGEVIYVGNLPMGMEVDGMDIGCGRGPGWYWDYELNQLVLEGRSSYAVSGSALYEPDLLVKTSCSIVFSGCGFGHYLSSAPAMTALAPVTVSFVDCSWFVGGEGSPAIDGEVTFESGTVRLTPGEGYSTAVDEGCEMNGGNIVVESGTRELGFEHAGTVLHEVRLALPQRKSAPVSWSVAGLPSWYRTDNLEPVDGEFHFYLPDGDYAIVVNGVDEYQVTVAGAPAEAEYVKTPTGVTVNDVDCVYGSDLGWTYDSVTGVVTLDGTVETYDIEGMNTNGMVRFVASANSEVETGWLDLGGYGEGAAAISVSAGASVRCTVWGTASLAGGELAPAVRVPTGAAFELVGEEDSEAYFTGGRRAAAVGGGSAESAGRITVKSGYVVALGGEGEHDSLGGAALGGGWSGAGGEIRIEGGELFVTGGAGAAAIGGGSAGNGGTVAITGGTVVAKTVPAALMDPPDAIGGGAGGQPASKVTIIGGSLVADADIDALPVTSLDDRAWRVRMSLPEGMDADGALTVTGLGDYGVNDVYAHNGEVVFHLPDGEYVFSVQGVWFSAEVAGADTDTVTYESTGITVNDVDVCVAVGEGWTWEPVSGLLEITGPGPYVISGMERDGVKVVLSIKGDVSATFEDLHLADGAPVRIAEGARLSLMVRGDNFEQPQISGAGTLRFVSGTASLRNCAAGKTVVDGGSVFFTGTPPDMVANSLGQTVRQVLVTLPEECVPFAGPTFTGLPEYYDTNELYAVEGEVSLYLPYGVWELDVTVPVGEEGRDTTLSRDYTVSAEGVTAEGPRYAVVDNGKGGTEKVPYVWLEGYGLASNGMSRAEYRAAAEAPSVNGGGGGRLLPVWKSYIAGLDPTDPGQAFYANIVPNADGTFVVGPNAERAERVYVVIASEALPFGDNVKLFPVPRGSGGVTVGEPYHFFKVKVGFE